MKSSIQRALAQKFLEAQENGDGGKMVTSPTEDSAPFDPFALPSRSSRDNSAASSRLSSSAMVCFSIVMSSG
jgi:hypothetical protein